MSDVLARADDVVEQEVDGERVLVPLRADLADLTRLWTLNRTGAAVWALLDGTRGEAEVVAAIVARFRTTVEEAAPQVRALLEALLAAGLVRRV